MPSRFAKTFHGCWCVCKCLLFQLFCLKGYLLRMLQFCYFSFKHKRQIMQFELQERRILIIFHGIFGVAMRFVISQFFFFFFFLIVPYHFYVIWSWTTFYDAQNDLQMFAYIQRCHSDCWLDKLSISFDNYLAEEDKYLYYGSAVIKPCFYRFIV